MQKRARAWSSSCAAPGAWPRAAAAPCVCPARVRAVAAAPPATRSLGASAGGVAHGERPSRRAFASASAAGRAQAAGARATTLTQAEYVAVADETLDNLEDVLGALEDEVDIDDFDCTNAVSAARAQRVCAPRSRPRL